MKYYNIKGHGLNAIDSVNIVESGMKIRIDAAAMTRVKKSRALVEKWISNKEVIYGVNTGFGEFKDVIISQENTAALQKNLILSHSAGVGSFIPDNIARLMLLFRINSLAKGFSGIRSELLLFLVDFFNSGIIPLVPSQGSVGSSGDLAPLSHMALAFTGGGFAKFKGKVLPAKKVLKLAGMKPVVLSAKEGLALINGTQMMSAYLCKSLCDAINLSKLADISAAMSVEASRGTAKAYSSLIQAARPHPGQIASARNLRILLKNSEIMKSHSECGKVQDAYSIRCIPQVHGAVKDTINYCKRVLEIEINSATDNPLIFPGTGEHIEGGNFHGEPLAFASDFLSIAISELGSISERRIARLLDGSLSGLPRFLTSKGGLNSGLMIAQYTAAALVSENKVLCHPASVDSIPTSANQEDHNSMGSVAARKCFKVINNVKNIIAVEFLAASQGLDFLRPLKAGKGAEAAYNIIRNRVKHISRDRLISDEIARISETVFHENFISAVENKSGLIIV